MTLRYDTRSVRFYSQWVQPRNVVTPVKVSPREVELPLSIADALVRQPEWVIILTDSAEFLHRFQYTLCIKGNL